MGKAGKDPREPCPKVLLEKGPFMGGPQETGGGHVNQLAISTTIIYGMVKC